MKSDLQEINNIFNQELIINEVAYGWAMPLSYNFNPNMIVYHHTVETNITPQQINELHKARFWAGIGYHFYIRKNATVPENALGSL